jgi:hypothetical protein
LHAAVECAPSRENLREDSWESWTLRSWLNGNAARANASGNDYSGNEKNFLDSAFSACADESGYM